MSVGIETPIAEQAFVEVGPFAVYTVLDGDDGIGVHIGHGQTGGQARKSMGRCRTHAILVLGSVMRPTIALAAAVAGLARWVRPPRP